MTRWRGGSTRLRKGGTASRLAFFRDQELDRWYGQWKLCLWTATFSGGTSRGPANQWWMLLAQVASAGSLPGRTVLIFHLWFYCLRETPSARLGIDQSVHSVLLSFTLGKAVVQPCDVYHVWVWPSGLSTSQQTKEGSRLSTFFYLALVPLWPLCICKTDIYTLW